MAQRQTV